MANKKWTREAIIAEIQESAKETGYASSGDLRGLHSTIQIMFGSWAEACEAAGVKAASQRAGQSPKRKAYFEPKRDCAFYIRDTMCYGLNAMYCKTDGKCNFYKPMTEDSVLFEPVKSVPHKKE